MITPGFVSYGNLIVPRAENAAQCGHLTEELIWLQRWFAAQCDGQWEHGFGITIETLDNPGWSVRICVEGTRLEFAQFEPVKTDVQRNRLDSVSNCRKEKGSAPQPIAELSPI